VKIVVICGAGIGSSGILKVNTERVLKKLDINATVQAVDLASLADAAVDAQVILTSAEFVDAIAAAGATRADVIVVTNYFDSAELTEKIEAALG
jgi:PTS system ascorbate-specific IIB component